MRDRDDRRRMRCLLRVISLLLSEVAVFVQRASER